MKAFMTLGALLCLCLHADAQLVTNQPARLAIKITSYEGKIGSGTCSTCLNPTPDAVFPGNSGSDEVTSPGRESKLKWTFVGRNKEKDVYEISFTRKTKANSSDQRTDSKEIQFEGKKVVVFEDELHAVVMENPNEADLKQCQKH